MIITSSCRGEQQALQSQSGARVVPLLIVSAILKFLSSKSLLSLFKWTVNAQVI